MAHSLVALAACGIGGAARADLVTIDYHLYTSAYNEGGSFTYDSAKTGILGFVDLTSFTMNTGRNTYDLAFATTQLGTSYLGWNTATNSFADPKGPSAYYRVTNGNRASGSGFYQSYSSGLGYGYSYDVKNDPYPLDGGPTYYGIVGTKTVTAQASVPTIVADGAFGNYAIFGGKVGYAYNPTGQDWTFSSNSGLSTNGSAFGYTSDSGYTAFLQGTGSISQMLSGLDPNMNYELDFSLASRGTYGVDPVAVTLGGRTLGTFKATSNTQKAYAVAFNPGSASSLLAFTGLGTSTTGDDEVGLSDVVIRATGAVPEPGSWAMFIVGFGLAGALLRRSAGRDRGLGVTRLI